ncbi:MAG TPA: Hpt domain-containing protein [Bacteroidetes bacterium]|nr:Hpt domain-containing protein [Bacteroidota bacterium]
MSGKESLVNLKYLEEMTGGSRELVKEMIDIFISQIPEFIEEMRKLHKKNDWHSLGLLAHKAKSSVAIMGMEEQAAKLKKLEQLTKEEKETGQYENYINQFEKNCLRAIEELQLVKNNL